MRIRSIVFLLTTIICQKVCLAQGPPFQNSTHWTIYNLRGSKFGNVTLDSLDNYAHKTINTDSMRLFLKHSSALPTENPPMWMGAFVTSCIINEKKRKIDISTYGGFLFDETEGRYYEIQQDDQKEWLNYLAGCVGALQSTKQ